MTDHRVYRLTAATPDRSGYQKARADAAARAARGQTYLDQRPMGGPGVIRRCLAAPAGLHPGKSQRVDVSYFGARGYLPLGVALLWAAVLGILPAVIAWFGRGVRIRAAIAGIAGPDAKRGSAHSQKQSAAQTPCAQAGLQGQEARRAGRLSVCKGSGIRYAATPVASYGRSSGQDQYGRISMRHSAKRISPLIVIVVAGCLAAGCGGSITSSIGSVPSRTATISARPTVTAAPTTQPPAAVRDHVSADRAVQRLGDVQCFLWHQPPLAMDPAGCPSPRRPDGMDRPFSPPPLGGQGKPAIKAHRRLCQRRGSS